MQETTEMARQLSREEANAIHSLINVLERFRSLNPDMPIQQMLMFFDVATHEGTSLKDVCARMDIAQSTGSRNIIGLTKEGKSRDDRGGLNLVRTFDDPEDYRRKIIELTPDGRVLLMSILKATT